MPTTSRSSLADLNYRMILTPNWLAFADYLTVLPWCDLREAQPSRNPTCEKPNLREAQLSRSPAFESPSLREAQPSRSPAIEKPSLREAQTLRRPDFEKPILWQTQTSRSPDFEKPRLRISKFLESQSLSSKIRHFRGTGKKSKTAKSVWKQSNQSCPSTTNIQN